MIEGKKRDCNRLLRGATVALALLLVIAQSFATAHYHQKDFRDTFAQCVPGNDALCSLCFFHFHAPASPVALVSDRAPAVPVWRLTQQAILRPHTRPVALLFSRAPPVLR
jgi:hypothetical protein